MKRLAFLFRSLLLTGLLNGSVTAWAASPPPMPELNAEQYSAPHIQAHQRNVLDQVEAAAPSMPKVPDIEMKPSSVDIGLIADRYQQKIANMNVQKPTNAFYIFVSMSMPEAALMKLAHAARKADATLVFRGIPGGLSKTRWSEAMLKLKPLTDTGANVIIHPEYFQRYDVTQVPTFVLTANDSVGCRKVADKQCGTFLSAVGDVSLDYVLNYWLRQSALLEKQINQRLSLLEQDL